MALEAKRQVFINLEAVHIKIAHDGCQLNVDPAGSRIAGGSHLGIDDLESRLATVKLCKAFYSKSLSFVYLLILGEANGVPQI